MPPFLLAAVKAPQHMAYPSGLQTSLLTGALPGACAEPPEMPILSSCSEPLSFGHRGENSASPCWQGKSCQHLIQKLLLWFVTPCVHLLVPHSPATSLTGCSDPGGRVEHAASIGVSPDRQMAEGGSFSPLEIALCGSERCQWEVSFPDLGHCGFPPWERSQTTCITE